MHKLDNMKMIPAATELIRSKFPDHDGVFVLRNVEEFMIEFAKLHVKAALEAAADSAQTKTTSCYTNASGNEKGELYEDVEIIDEDSILNAYSENLIH